MNRCQICHQPLHIYEQPALVPWKLPRLEAECVNPTCPVYMGSAALSDFPLTETQVREFSAHNTRQAVRA